MKLVRYGSPGAERPGLVDAEGHLRDLSRIVPDIGPQTLGREALNQIAEEAACDLSRVFEQTRLGAPVGGIGKFIAVGLNYRDHAEEANMPIPAEPVSEK